MSNQTDVFKFVGAWFDSTDRGDVFFLWYCQETKAHMYRWQSWQSGPSGINDTIAKDIVGDLDEVTLEWMMEDPRAGYYTP